MAAKRPEGGSKKDEIRVLNSMVDGPAVLPGRDRHALVWTGGYWQHFWDGCGRDGFRGSRRKNNRAERRHSHYPGDHDAEFWILYFLKSDGWQLQHYS